MAEICVVPLCKTWEEDVTYFCPFLTPNKENYNFSPKLVFLFLKVIGGVECGVGFGFYFTACYS
jgi:hypothetical protein